MLRKSLNYSTYRIGSHLLSFSSRFSTNEVKQLNHIKESEEKGEVTKNEEELESVDSSKMVTLTKKEKLEIQRSIKSPLEYDALWELNNQSEKSYNQITDFFWQGRKGLSTDLYVFLHHKWDFSITGFKRRLKHYIELREQYNQRFIAQRHGILGPELATAHFITYRGGRVRFKHAPDNWVTNIEQFPNKYDKRYKLISVDASNIKLRYEAFDNLSTLVNLEELNLSNNKQLDDWSCDKIGRIFRNSTTLSVLNLSGNPLITHRGIETLHRIRSLKKLIITGTKAAQYPFLELLVILFNDINPDCEIIA